MSLLIRSQQSRLGRAVDVLLTLSAWAAMAYLLVQGVASLLASGRHGPRPALVAEIMPTLDTLLIYLLVALGLGTILLAWAKYNERRAGWYQRRSRMPDIAEETLAANFQVSLAILDCLQRQQVLILHNGEDGALAAIEFPGTALRLPALASDELLESLRSEEAPSAEPLAG
ncbi:poly-beta-1,6-N-acetyl-D-glucosamine biosynthesis protein PgaD [Pseudomonas sp. AOB-7]|uniref:poly-beta-1,6-N-acetyl-D-glucosamine biosynthesis protein PgaD n=1 Tax=unclassified Pseudomonas TaxID=196821 RepID=UPI000EFBC8D5|nr:poly-beta-1,6-N-acetyl-D-glucosamine biosynthesis protein PgaD [Pseudomonas sp. AOB-7]RMH82127.1 poly-beta-1,6-N-acetyl-D-glucosamine biosynthesis protein PgaD [Pseudomonas sp. AOB-7]